MYFFCTESLVNTAINNFVEFSKLVEDENYQNALDLGHKILSIFEQIFGEIHPLVSCHMSNIQRINALQRIYDEDVAAFVYKAATCIQLTHGSNHELYKTTFPRA